MKTTIKMRKIVILLAAMFTFSIAAADELEKSYQKEFEVNKNAILHIDNQFGEIKCQNWNKNMVSIEVIVTVEARNESKAEKYLDWIEVSLSGDRNRVEGITSLGSGHSYENADISIDYKIMMPNTLNIDFVNKFGDIIMEEIEGPVTIELTYGDLDISALNNEKNNIVIKFGEGDIGYLKSGEVKIEYAELEIDDCQDVIFDTKFSELDIEKAGELEITSQYDEYTIGSAGPLDITAKFSDFEIDVQNGTFSYDFQYGELSVDRVMNIEGKCTIENSFADISLSFSPEAAFSIDAETRFGDLSYPMPDFDIDHEEKGFTTHIYTGTYNGGSSSDMLYIRSKNASVYLNN